MMSGIAPISWRSSPLAISTRRQWSARSRRSSRAGPRGRTSVRVRAFRCRITIPRSSRSQRTARLRAAVTEGERVAQHGFTSTELERAKSEMMRGMESAYAEREKTASAAFVSEYEGAFLEHTAIPSIAQQYALYQQLVPGIKLAEVNALAQ